MAKSIQGAAQHLEYIPPPTPKLMTVLRKQRGWTKRELARRAGLNENVVGQIENGRSLPYQGQLEKLAKALRVKVANAPSLLEPVKEGTGVCSK